MLYLNFKVRNRLNGTRCVIFLIKHRHAYPIHLGQHTNFHYISLSFVTFSIKIIVNHERITSTKTKEKNPVDLVKETESFYKIQLLNRGITQPERLERVLMK
jgi:hypothetical protein